MGLAYFVNLAFVYSLSAFWSAVMVARMTLQIFRYRMAFFETKPRPTPPPALTNPEWHHARVQLSEVGLHYVQMGEASKPLMLFVHGFPEFWYTWRHQLRYFQKNYRVVAVDLRGYGDSDKPSGIHNYTIEKLVQDLAELVPALGYDSAVVVSHDWGGAICWQLAINHPELVNRFIVCNCPHPSAFRKALRGGSFKQFLKSWYMFFFQAPFLPELMLRSRDMGSLEVFLRKPPMGTRNPNAFTDDDMETWKYTFQQPGHLTPPLNYYRAALTRDPSKGEFSKKSGPRPKIRPPTLIVWGTGDGAIEQSTAEMSGPYCQDCTIRYIEGASHWVQNDEPDLVNQYIDQFLQSNPQH